VKSEVSLVRCLALISVSVVSIILAYKLGKEHRWKDTGRPSPQPTNHRIALHEGQTIVGVSDTTPSMRFYIGNDVMDGTEYD
jgi:hypothetical protein